MSLKLTVYMTCLAGLCLAVVLSAADVTGSINGVVKDPSGAIAPGIDVVALNTGTNAVFHATTDETGTYFLRELPVGSYQLSLEPRGFKKFIANDLRVQV